jgi:hypothetical protein
LVRHLASHRSATEVIGGLRVVSLAEAVGQIAATTSFREGVMVTDAALHRSGRFIAGLPTATISQEQILAHIDGIATNHGARRARCSVEFGHGDCESPGESVSRVTMHFARIPPPVLQATLRGASGRPWRVDFWWPEFNVIGESDGKSKYVDAALRNGRSPAEVLYDEKLREDDLRATGKSFARWPWEVAMSVPLLRARLVGAGVRC